MCVWGRQGGEVEEEEEEERGRGGGKGGRRKKEEEGRRKERKKERKLHVSCVKGPMSKSLAHVKKIVLCLRSGGKHWGS